jgi:hypothetical protein
MPRLEGPAGSDGAELSTTDISHHSISGTGIDTPEILRGTFVSHQGEQREKLVDSFFTVPVSELRAGLQDGDWGTITDEHVEKAARYYLSLGHSHNMSQYKNVAEPLFPIYQQDPKKWGAVSSVLQQGNTRQEDTGERKKFYENRPHGAFADIAEVLPMIANRFQIFGRGAEVQISQTAKEEDRAGGFSDFIVSINIADALRSADEMRGHPIRRYTDVLKPQTKHFVFDVTSKTNAEGKVRDRANALKRSGGKFSDILFYWRRKKDTSGPPRLSELGISGPPKLILKTDPQMLLAFLSETQPDIVQNGNAMSVRDLQHFKESYTEFFLGSPEHPGATRRLLQDTSFLIEQTLGQYDESGYMRSLNTEHIIADLRNTQDPLEYHKKLMRLKLTTPDPQREETLKKLAELKLSLHFLIENAEIASDLGKNKPVH